MISIDITKKSDNAIIREILTATFSSYDVTTEKSDYGFIRFSGLIFDSITKRYSPYHSGPMVGLKISTGYGGTIRKVMFKNGRLDDEKLVAKVTELVGILKMKSNEDDRRLLRAAEVAAIKDTYNQRAGEIQPTIGIPFETYRSSSQWCSSFRTTAKGFDLELINLSEAELIALASTYRELMAARQPEEVAVA